MPNVEGSDASCFDDGNEGFRKELERSKFSTWRTAKLTTSVMKDMIARSGLRDHALNQQADDIDDTGDDIARFNKDYLMTKLDTSIVPDIMKLLDGDVTNWDNSIGKRALYRGWEYFNDIHTEAHSSSAHWDEDVPLERADELQALYRYWVQVTHTLKGDHHRDAMVALARYGMERSEEVDKLRSDLKDMTANRDELLKQLTSATQNPVNEQNMHAQQ